MPHKNSVRHAHNSYLDKPLKIENASRSLPAALPDIYSNTTFRFVW